MTFIRYEKFSYLEETAAEHGIGLDRKPDVRRTEVDVDGGRLLSAICWGPAPAEIVFLHGGSQNAHTWDAVALAMGRSAIALDLPGHGHSDVAPQAHADFERHGDDLAVAIRTLAPGARAVVGMSLGGLAAISIVDRNPDLAPALALVDVTPGVTSAKARSIIDRVDQTHSFRNIDEMVDRLAAGSSRSPGALRRGVLHNALQLEDGTWVWRYARQGPVEHRTPDCLHLWQTFSGIRVPVLLIRGGGAGSVVDDADVDELLRRCPSAQVAVVPGAGHNVQADAPLELAGLLDAFLAAHA